MDQQQEGQQQQQQELLGDGLVSRLVNYVAKSSPIRNSNAHLHTSFLSSPIALDEEVSTGNRRLKTSFFGSSRGSLSGCSGETKFYSPETSSASSNSSLPIMNELQTASTEDLQKLNQVLEMTDIGEPEVFEPKSSILRTNSLEGAVKIELLQEEVASLQEKLARANAETCELRQLVEEYEQTMSLIIDARKQKNEQFVTTEQLQNEKRLLEGDLQTMQISFQNLHQRYDDLKSLYDQQKMHENTLRQNVAGLQSELVASERRYENLRRHAEEKIEEANRTINEQKKTFEDEISATKAKLLKAELRISSLESAVEAKAKENSELMAICDELISKIDRK